MRILPALCAAFWAQLAFSSGQIVILEQPLSRVAAPGARVVFHVSADGSGRLRYQWMFENREWTGATNRDLVFVATPGRAGTYAARVSDNEGVEMSAPARLEVLPRPRVLVQPITTVVGVGKSTAFEVVLNESGPYSAIAWHNSNSIEGSHIIPDGLGSDVHSTRLLIADCAKNPIYEGFYWISVTNAVGGTVSRKARLKVVGPPRLIGNPRDAIIAPGGTARFSVSWASDEAPWKRASGTTKISVSLGRRRVCCW